MNKDLTHTDPVTLRVGQKKSDSDGNETIKHTFYSLEGMKTLTNAEKHKQRLPNPKD